MALVRDGAENAQKMVERQDREKPKANDRSRLESALAEIWMIWFNNVVKTNHGLMDLGADAANEPIAKRRQPAQKNSRSSFGAPISLWQRRQCDVPVGHCGFKSAVVYSGSSSP